MKVSVQNQLCWYPYLQIQKYTNVYHSNIANTLYIFICITQNTLNFPNSSVLKTWRKKPSHFYFNNNFVDRCEFFFELLQLENPFAHSRN